jgi:hypothetical protein
MKRFIDYLDKLQSRKKLTKTQLYFAVFGILLFLALALTLPNYILRNRQTLRGQAQQAPSMPPPPAAPNIIHSLSPVTLGAAPESANAVVGNPFSIDVTIDSQGQQFNAAEATVTVSTNLSVTGISTPSTNPCNFVYTLTPTISDPSFAGAILAASSEQCNVYTLNITPLSTGTGTITFTNASIKAYTDNSEILSFVIDGSYALTNPAPTNTPVPPTPIPTNTPVPPTATPIPPTSTSVPTNTPVPTTSLLSAPSVVQPESPTYLSSALLQGTKTTSLTNVYVNDSTNAMTYPTNTTWESSVSLSFGLNTLTIYGRDSLDNQSASRSVAITRHRLGDISGDTFINLTDISLFAADWRKTSNLNNNLSDMNNDSNVDLTDFSIIAKQYGQ